LIGVFLEECPKLLDEMRRGIDEEDAALLNRAAHTIKGSLYLFQYDVAIQQAADLEEKGRSGDFRGSQSAFSALESELERLRAALVAFAPGDGMLDAGST
jgi:HPt (histidine-containing phosphotransfer) domain-containing protein